MINTYFQRLRPYPLCQPTLTYSKEGISFEVNATSDLLMEALHWSINSTESDVRIEIWVGYPNGDEYSESTCMYTAVDDKVFMK